VRPYVGLLRAFPQKQVEHRSRNTQARRLNLGLHQASHCEDPRTGDCWNLSQNFVGSFMSSQEFAQERQRLCRDEFATDSLSRKFAAVKQYDGSATAGSRYGSRRPGGTAAHHR